MSISWSTIEAAIHTWAVAGTGLAASNVIWAGQNAPQPDDTFVTLRGVVTPIGLDWVNTQDASPPVAGAELDYFARGTRLLTLTVSCFGGSHRGSTSPQGLLNAMLSSAGLETRRDALNAAGWVPARVDGPVLIDGVVGGALFEPRATMQCMGQVASEVTETGTYIQIVEVENTLTGEIAILDTEA